jgi:hypothetical protein
MLLVGTDFIDNNASFNTQLKRDGAKVLVQAYATSGAVADTPMAIQFMGSGYNATALVAIVYAYVGVPYANGSVASGSVGWFIIRGPVSSVQGSAAEAVGSVGHSLAWTAATIYASTSANQGLNTAGQIGVLTTAANASTTLDIYLTGVWATPK